MITAEHPLSQLLALIDLLWVEPERSQLKRGAPKVTAPPRVDHGRLHCQILKLLEMWWCEQGRRSAQIGVKRADIAERRLGIGVAEVLLNRHERDAGLIQPRGIGAAQVIGPRCDDLAEDGQRIAIERILHSAEGQRSPP